MTDSGQIDLDVVIFGGGATGLWLLESLLARKHRVLLLESGDLGSGQTIASQGIIHGGLKYTLSGMFTSSAKAIREMPGVWRRCLAGENHPDLRRTKLRAPACHLWQTSTLSSKVAMIGARAGLRVAPVALDQDQRPEVLKNCPGIVARLDEQVIEPDTFLLDLADRLRPQLLKIDTNNGLEFTRNQDGSVSLIRLINPETGEPIDLKPRQVIFAAGSGNASLRESVGLSANAMQRRPLHMVLMKGNLPILNGHCVDGKATRLTITTTVDHSGMHVWQVGGQLAEHGVDLKSRDLIAHAKREIREALPDLNMSGVSWATYRVDRAEPAHRGGFRPSVAKAIHEGNVITAWPTKLTLAPRLTDLVQDLILPPDSDNNTHQDVPTFRGWPRPNVALPPWETELTWYDENSAEPDLN